MNGTPALPLEATKSAPTPDAVTVGERGSALVEFLGGAVVLLIPLVYLVLTLAQLQGAQFAAVSAARDAGRLIATADRGEAAALASSAVVLAFADHGLAVGADALTVQCEDACRPGTNALILVAADVPLPFVPGGAITVGVSAQAWVTIDTFREHR